MPDDSPPDSASGKTALEPYWNRVAERYAGADPLSAICYPGAPTWLNRFFADLQERAVSRALRNLPLEGMTALDVGCGVGRWTRWLAQRRARVTGIDSTEAMLEVARRQSSGIDFRCMSAAALDFPDAAFDLVLCVTVIQHLEPSEQLTAIGELCRIVRPGGHLLVVDLIDVGDRGKVVHPRPPEEWIAHYTSHSMHLEAWQGLEYVPLIRAFRWCAETIAGALGIASPEGGSLLERERGSPAMRAAYAGLWLTVQMSRALERPCEVLVPDRLSRHGCFRFRKVLGETER